MRSFHLVKAGAAVAALALSVTSAQAQLVGNVDVTNPNNVLTGSTGANTSSGGGIFGGGPFTVIDNRAADTTQDSDYLFFDNDGTETLGLSGFSAPGGFQTVRIFTAPEDPPRLPLGITVRSSTTDTAASLNASDYETLLGTFTSLSAFQPYSPDDPTGTRRGFSDLSVSAPAGTQSLFLDFDGGGTRVYELQALVPEPGALSLLGLGAVGLLARRRRNG